jgi:hypothetical protein
MRQFPHVLRPAPPRARVGAHVRLGAELEARLLLSQRWTGLGPLLPFVCGCSVAASARRGRRCPARAHAVAVAAARSPHCAARSGVASQNSLRSLRSLRSNSCDESVHEARAARVPTPALRCSSPPKSPPPGSACREVHGGGGSMQTAPPCQQRRVRAGRGAPLRRRGAQGSWPRAQRASITDSSQLFERSERSEHSEFCDGPGDRAPQGSRCAAPTASAKRRGLPARAFARANARTQSGHSTAAKGRQRNVALLPIERCKHRTSHATHRSH